MLVNSLLEKGCLALGCVPKVQLLDSWSVVEQPFFFFPIMNTKLFKHRIGPCGSWPHQKTEKGTGHMADLLPLIEALAIAFLMEEKYPGSIFGWKQLA